MKIQYISVIFALLTFSSAFTVPHGTTDGLYIHILHHNGTSTHHPLSAALDTAIVQRTPRRAKYSKRVAFGSDEYKPSKEAEYTKEAEQFRADVRTWPQTSDFRFWTHCGNEHGLKYRFKQTAFDDAMALFKAGCDPKVDLGNDGNDYYVVSGEIVLFMCNWAQHGQWCKGYEMDWAISNIQSQCTDGLNLKTELSTGWFNYVGWAKAYGFDKVGNKICRE